MAQNTITGNGTLITHVAKVEDGRGTEVAGHTLGSGWVRRYGIPLN
ncbi:hypothetical protein [Streptomyces sp. NPDC051993]